MVIRDLVNMRWGPRAVAAAGRVTRYHGGMAKPNGLPYDHGQSMLFEPSPGGSRSI